MNFYKQVKLPKMIYTLFCHFWWEAYPGGETTHLFLAEPSQGEGLVYFHYNPEENPEVEKILQKTYNEFHTSEWKGWF
jgi:hypothetical protein